MELLLSSMRKHFPRLNKVGYGFDDVHRIARKHGAECELAPYGGNILGYFCIKRKAGKRGGHTKHIVINSDLGPVMRDFVALHEVCHFLHHAPLGWQDWYYCRKSARERTRRHDCEADAFALIALIPFPLLAELHDTHDIDEELMRLALRRNELWLKHGL